MVTPDFKNGSPPRFHTRAKPQLSIPTGLQELHALDYYDNWLTFYCAVLSTIINPPHPLQYAMYSQLELRGQRPQDALLEILPRKGEDTIRQDDIIEVKQKILESL